MTHASAQRADELAIRVRQLSRRFSDGSGSAVLALDNVDLSVQRGAMHGLLGPNGAGKTTLTKVLTTVLSPSSGRAEVMGLDVVTQGARLRPMIGVAFGGERGLYSRVSVRQNMRFWAALYNLPGKQARMRCDSLIERFGLAGKADTRVEELSRGMKQRVHLAKALVGDPAVLFLDEPSAGFDPVAARDLRSLLAEMKNEGRTILISTHDMVEAETLCDQVSLIDHGRILVTASSDELVRRVPMHDRVDFTTPSLALIEEVKALACVAQVQELGDDRFRVVPRLADEVPEILRFLVERGVVDLTTRQPSLEEAYVDIIGDRGSLV